MNTICYNCFGLSREKELKKLTAKRAGINAENKDQKDYPRISQMNTNQRPCHAPTKTTCDVHSELPGNENTGVNAKRQYPLFLRGKFLGNEKA
jgi:hypothetical protein